jgi:hypothetical protein
MSTGDRILAADGPDGLLFACIASGTRTAGQVAALRFTAFLTPYPDEAAARDALKAAGGTNTTEGGKR